MSVSVVGQVGSVGVAPGPVREPAGMGQVVRDRAERTFSTMLERMEGAAHGKAAPKTEDGAAGKAREAAEELVAATLVRPLLAQMRETNQAAPPFAPGHWEKTFGPLVDAEVATRIVRASRWALVDEMASDFAARSRGVRPGADPATAGREVGVG